MFSLRAHFILVGRTSSRVCATPEFPFVPEQMPLSQYICEECEECKECQFNRKADSIEEISAWTKWLMVGGVVLTCLFWILLVQRVVCYSSRKLSWIAGFGLFIHILFLEILLWTGWVTQMFNTRQGKSFVFFLCIFYNCFVIDCWTNILCVTHQVYWRSKCLYPLYIVKPFILKIPHYFLSKLRPQV